MSRQQLWHAVYVCVCVWEMLWQSLWEKASCLFPGCLYINLLSLSVILKWRRDIVNYKWRCLRLRTGWQPHSGYYLTPCLDTTVELAVVFVVVCLLCNLWATCAPRFKCAACVSVCVCVYGGMVSTKSMACIKH